MKKTTIIVRIITTVLFLSALVFAGCSVLQGGTDDQRDKGWVNITIGGAGERTLIPSEIVFDKYSFSFVGEGTNPGIITIAKGQNIEPVTLDKGEWTINAKAYVTILGEDREAAEGSVAVTILAGETTPAVIVFETGIRDEVPGKFSYTIDYPDGVTLGQMSFSSVLGEALPVGAAPTTPLNLLGSGKAGTVSLYPGYYLVQVTLENGRQIIKSDVLHIYSGMQTNAHYSFVENDFTDVVIMHGTITTDLHEGDALLRVIAYSTDNYLVPVASSEALWSGSGCEWTLAVPDTYTNVYLRLNAENDGVSIPRNMGSKPVGTANIELHANWLAVLIYDGSGNTGGNVPEIGVYLDGSGIVLAYTSIEKTDRVFGGWNTAADGSGTTYQPGDVFTIGSADATLYALWVPYTYTDAYNTPGTIRITGYTGNSQNIVIPGAINGKIVTEIGDSAFYDKRLSSVVIPDSVTYIGGNAFASNRLTSIKLNDNITYIGHSAFYNNRISGELKLPAALKIIESNVFQQNGITSLTIPAGVTSIGSSAFDGNAITNIVISDGVTNIGNSAFNSNQISELIIPDSVTEIESYAFSSNPLRKIHTGNGITRIREYTFAWNNYPYNGDQSELIIGSKVEQIDQHAFQSNGFTSIVIPQSVTFIAQFSFADSQRLQSVTIGSDVSIDFENAITGSFDNNRNSFKAFYEANGMQAGTYVYSGDSTTGTWAIYHTGSLTVTVDFTKPQDEVISLPTGNQTILSRSTGNTLTASVNGMYDSYQWIVNGTLAGGGNSIALRSSDFTDNGEYRVTIIVYKNGVPYSAKFNFAIVN